MSPIAWFFIAYITLTVLGLWMKKVNIVDKLYPKVPEFIPYFGYNSEKKSYYPVIFRRGWFLKHIELEFKDALCPNPDEAVYNSRALIDRVLVPIYKNPLPKYKLSTFKAPPK